MKNKKDLLDVINNCDTLPEVVKVLCDATHYDYVHVINNNCSLLNHGIYFVLSNWYANLERAFTNIDEVLTKENAGPSREYVILVLSKTKFKGVGLIISEYKDAVRHLRDFEVKINGLLEDFNDNNLVVCKLAAIEQELLKKYDDVYNAKLKAFEDDMYFVTEHPITSPELLEIQMKELDPIQAMLKELRSNHRNILNETYNFNKVKDEVVLLKDKIKSLGINTLYGTASFMGFDDSSFWLTDNFEEDEEV